jgi:hypothetical protein
MVRLALAYDHQRDYLHAQQKHRKRAAEAAPVRSSDPKKKRNLPTFLQRTCMPSKRISGGGSGGGGGGGGSSGGSGDGSTMGNRKSGSGKKVHRRKSGGL